MQKWLFQDYWHFTKSLVNWKHRTNLCGSLFGGTFPAGIIPKISFLHKHILVWFFRKAIVSRYKGRYLKPIYEILNYTLSFKNKVIYLHLMIKFIKWHQLVMNWSWFDQGQGIRSWEQRVNDTLPVNVFLK